MTVAVAVESFLFERLNVFRLIVTYAYYEIKKFFFFDIIIGAAALIKPFPLKKTFPFFS